jgi:transcriptional regulator with XRE-family HTH domain
MPRPRSLKRFGGFLKERREAKHLTAQQVVLRLKTMGIGLDQSTLYNWETGTVKAPDPVALWGLAKIYQVSHDGLIELLLKSQIDTGEAIPFPASADETAEERLLTRIRGLRAEARRRLLKWLDFEEHQEMQRRLPDSEKQSGSGFREQASDRKDHRLRPKTPTS